ncbi:hypothetical protein CMUS01_08657 [Colletotrichum musicola]|uniref:Uncharacterized protein n=1 Tax=Colletotrichum musicola TaxID=2175873 RepID=A0A8H6NCW7_9PEZI|nr:hypothetical protein CMUS01_08657 [Colletotrichum musicola]
MVSTGPSQIQYTIREHPHFHARTLRRITTISITICITAASANNAPLYRVVTNPSWPAKKTTKQGGNAQPSHLGDIFSFIARHDHVSPPVSSFFLAASRSARQRDNEAYPRLEACLVSTPSHRHNGQRAHVEDDVVVRIPCIAISTKNKERGLLHKTVAAHSNLRHTRSTLSIQRQTTRTATTARYRSPDGSSNRRPRCRSTGEPTVHSGRQASPAQRSAAFDSTDDGLCAEAKGKKSRKTRRDGDQQDKQKRGQAVSRRQSIVTRRPVLAGR